MPRGQPFPVGDHKASINRHTRRYNKNKTETAQTIHKRSNAPQRSVKTLYWRAQTGPTARQPDTQPRCGSRHTDVWSAWKTPNLPMHYLLEHINQVIKRRFCVCLKLGCLHFPLMKNVKNTANRSLLTFTQDRMLKVFNVASMIFIPINSKQRLFHTIYTDYFGRHVFFFCWSWALFCRRIRLDDTPLWLVNYTSKQYIVYCFEIILTAKLHGICLQPRSSVKQLSMKVSSAEYFVNMAIN